MISEQKGPLVSVIMNCYNSEKYLKEAINSVLTQTYENWEIIFWDNNSSDQSASIALSFQDKRIRYFKAKSTVPLYEARNLAINKCSGDLIGFLDCDDLWTEEKLEKQVRLYRTGEKIIYGRFQLVNENLEPLDIPMHRPVAGRITNTLLKKNIISIGSILIDSALLKKNLFDPYYNLVGDFELWVRLSTQFPFACISDLVELSRQHGNNLSNQLRSEWIIEQRRFYRLFLQKHSILKYPSILWFIFRNEIKFYFERVRKNG